MWIDQNLQTRLIFTTFDGNEVAFCSLPCASKYLNEHKANIKRMQVADYLTTELVDADAAFYLVGSDAPPVMSYLSFISFKDIAVAEKFQKLHGGNLMSFSEVLQLLQGY